MAHDVFISCAEEDRQIADVVCGALEGAGVRCWYAPRDVPYALDYEEAIVDAISESKLMVLILSEHSNNSAHVKREVQNAFREESQVPVLPFQVENISLNKALRYYLSSVQWMSALTPPLETHLQKLVAYVRSRLPQREEERDPTKQHNQPTEPEVKAEEGERGRAEENRPPPEAAFAVKQRAAESPILKTVRWVGEKPIRILILVLPVLFIIWAWVFNESRRQPTNQNATPASTQQSGQTQRASLTVAENVERGDALFSQGKFAEAEDYYSEAVRLEPDNASYQNKLGDSLARQEKYPEAESSYRAAVRLNPNEQRYHFKLGWVLKEQKDYAEAEKAFREALRLKPSDANVRGYLADTLYLQSKFAEAETQYSEAVRIWPRSAELRYGLGNALLTQRKNVEAKIQYQKAVELEPNNPTYQEALKRVR